ncbi:MAG: methylmalonyl-CoA epimerase [Euryarchaeota archaeon]|nr:methylmalonyl-CoA epimerase [Euryarchaeota archaeon]MDE1836118.1 methylmalonyl-CoA epimerase [Euryarchaeota archaeon]MDE1879408.1 methylmalonyl-CoA epimerase [Euryarchaeota archaeon]MDE2044096.1 methylmalonyl-CoA epimerase [Thermoplasmata archaeon]
MDHLGIAVVHLESAVPLWERSLGTLASPAEEVPSQKVRVRFLTVGESHLELLEPTSPEATIAKFLEKRGEGLHHIAFQVSDLRAKLSELSKAGVRLIDEAPRQGARGRWVAFAHPSSFGGVLTEFVSDRPGGGA